MNNKIKMLIGSLAAILVFAGIVVLYNQLSKDYKADNLVVNNTTSEGSITDTTQTDNTEIIEENKEESNENKEKANNFKVVNYDDENFTLDSFIGKPVVLNFWASWCSPCKEEFSDFQKAYEEYGDSVNFVMINLTDGSRETKETAMDFIDENKYTLPIYFDTEGNAANEYQIFSIPTTYFIDKDGNVVANVVGMIDEEYLNNGIGMINK